MASKNKPAILKQKSNEVSRVGTGKRLKAASRMATAEPVNSDDESEEELERNFALISSSGNFKQDNNSETDEEEEEGEEEEEDEEEEEEEDGGDQSLNERKSTEEGGASEDSDEDDNGEEDKVNIKEDVWSDDSSEDVAGSDSDFGHDISEDEKGESTVKSNDQTVQTEEDIKRELSTMSFEDIMKLQNKVGTKAYNKVAYGAKSIQAPEKKKRLNKNRPMEISAKRPAPFLRQVVPVKKTVLRDPRFDDLSGEYKPEIFEKTYSFIDDIKRKEKEMIKKKLKKVKTQKKKEQLELLLKRMVNQESEQKRRQLQREKELELKRKQRELVGQGQRPFFLKKSDKRRLELADKYSELKKSGKLENFLSKKRKRNAAKDRRKLPSHQTAQ